jgi:hypothetical protein
MGAIYSSAQLTIIAAAGLNSSYGLPGISRARAVVDRHEPVAYGHLRSWPREVESHIIRTRWASRGWS